MAWPFSVMTASVASISLARPASDEAEIFELRYLPADRRVIAANPLRQFAHAERSPAGTVNQKSMSETRALIRLPAPCDIHKDGHSCADGRFANFSFSLRANL
jgi:hypothetical protein